MNSGRSQDKLKSTMSGYVMGVVGLVLVIAGVAWLATMVQAHVHDLMLVAGPLVVVLGVLVLVGLYMLQPNQSRRADAVRSVRRHRSQQRTALGQSVLPQDQAESARAQLRVGPHQGQRRARQPDRDRRGDRLAGCATRRRRCSTSRTTRPSCACRPRPRSVISRRATRTTRASPTSRAARSSRTARSGPPSSRCVRAWRRSRRA